MKTAAGPSFSSRFKSLGGRLDTLFYVYAAAAVAVTIIEYAKGPKLLYGEGYTHYNNFLIFKHSFFNLLAGLDLYAPHPEQYYDLYKYSPTFALLMAPFALLPDLPGLLLWNLLNTLPLYWAVRMLPDTGERTRAVILWLLLLDVMTNMHNSQSNGLMAALFLLAFVCLERGRVEWASLWVVLSVFVKLFGVVFAALFVMYPRRRRAMLSGIGWTALLVTAPLVVVSVSFLERLYESWWALLAADHAGRYGLSLFGIVRAWFGLEPDTTFLAALGGVALLAPMLQVGRYRQPVFRRLMFVSMLIWVVIFNHKAESPTFILAMTGIVLWYFTVPRTRLRLSLLLAAVVLISLSPTDLFPASIRSNFIAPYELKALPAVLVWLAVQVDLWRTRVPEQPGRS